MTTRNVMTPPKAIERDKRFFGRYGAGGGPLLVLLGGIHGNEPGGIEAIERVLGELDRAQPEARGVVAGLIGNRPALAARRRYIDCDLNRAFTRERLREVRSGLVRDAEAAEQLYILTSIAGLRKECAGQRFFALDLHSSSSGGVPFATVGDTLRNRTFAMSLPVPLVLGIEEQIDGALLELLNREGFVTVGFEGGRHDDPVTIERHAALIRVALWRTGIIGQEAIPGLAASRELLESSWNDCPRVSEVRYRHAITPEDEFRMDPGWRHFQKVSKGAVLGRDRKGPVRAAENGVVLLPLYQTYGSDGFFLGREVKLIWLRFSRVLRRLGAPSLIRFLPGVYMRTEEHCGLLVDRRVARFYALQVFHLVGYRKRREHGAFLRVERRPE